MKNQNSKGVSNLPYDEYVRSSKSQVQNQVPLTSEFMHFPTPMWLPSYKQNVQKSTFTTYCLYLVFRSLTRAYHGMDFFGFTLLGVFSPSGIYRSMSFVKSGKFSATIFWLFFFFSSFTISLLSFPTSNGEKKVTSFIIVSQVSQTPFNFFSIYFC